MKALAENHGDTERVFLIGAEFQRGSSVDARESLDELAELANTAGAEIIGDGLQKLARPHAATFIGKGKAAEFAEHCRGKIRPGFDADLTFLSQDITNCKESEILQTEIVGTMVAGQFIYNNLN